MTIATTTHLNFRGDARAALEFYASVFGGDLAVVTYGQAGNVQDPAETDQLMWGQVASPDGFRVMAYDVPSRLPWDQGENAVFVSVRGETAEEIAGYWAELVVGGNVVVPLAPAQWSPAYGMVEDAYGVVWVLDVAVDYTG